MKSFTELNMEKEDYEVEITEIFGEKWLAFKIDGVTIYFYHQDDLPRTLKERLNRDH